MEVSFPEPTAANNLATAVATLHAENGYAVPNRFEAIILAPPKMTNYAEQRKVSLRCESINLPGRNLNSSTDSNIYGPTREVVNGVTYAEDINMTFQASSGLEERVFFEKWQALAFHERNWNVGYYNDYVSTVDIYLLDRQDNRRFGIKLMEAFPKTIGATDLSQSANNELIKLPVTFSFRYWTTLDTNRTVSLGGNASNTAVSSTRNFSLNMPASVTRLGGGSGGNVGNVVGAYTGPEEQYR
jgi:hypothetical protein